MRHHTVRFLPDNRVVTIHSGATLLEAAGQAGIILTSPCGGIGRCGKCRVQLLPGGKDVLACEYVIEHDIEVNVPEQSRFLRQQILQHGIDRDVPLKPGVCKVFVPGAWRGIEAFCEFLSEQAHIRPLVEGPFERELEKIAGNPAAKEGFRAVLFSYSLDQEHTGSDYPSFRLAAAEVGDTSASLYGASIDVGTTTVVVNLVDLNTGQVIATASGANPQARYGADVISRIQYASDPHRATHLQRCILEGLERLIGQAAESAGIFCKHIFKEVGAGDIKIKQFLLQLTVVQFGQVPSRT